jgi:hypothetical protein
MKRLTFFFTALFAAIMCLATSACSTIKGADGSTTTSWNITGEQLGQLTGLVTAIKGQKAAVTVVPTKAPPAGGDIIVGK